MNSRQTETEKVSTQSPRKSSTFFLHFLRKVEFTFYEIFRSYFAFGNSVILALFSLCHLFDDFFQFFALSILLQLFFFDYSSVSI